MVLLKGERIHLRPPEPSDMADFFHWVNDPEASGEFDVFGISSWVDIEKWLRQPAGPHDFFTMVIEGNESKTKIGLVVRYLAHPIMCHVEIGFQIWDKRERNKGYATEATKLFMDYLFSTKNISRIQATTHTQNRPAQRVLEKCGFSREGRLRNALFINGEASDVYVYGITRRKWKTVRNNGHSMTSQPQETITQPIAAYPK